ncbi:hypothetical protein H8S37_12535 [Mediterraneibacter sp. NSJ-55]|uniref:Uncharacterized protein n=1 Tax=Mediterraneibacter hominis TaxID=2763054 RepID=A0A923RQM7_9FIRM|nr:hypothetical protein [Mediterraneibacter hominis]MBC5689744.1 hypothetical protein [Mediterraneibacter hominis]
MKKIYACLIGNWVCLNDDPSCTMGIHNTSPDLWYEENAPIFSPFRRDAEHTFYQMDYVYIHYKGKDYRINPIFLQIVEQ